MFGVDAAKGEAILGRRHRGIIEILLAPSAEGRRASFRQAVLRLACDLLEVKALPLER